MLIVARKNLFSERTRLLISVGGVALSVFLISLLISLYRGWDEKVGGFVEDVNVDVWVASEGAEDFLTAASLLPTGGREAEEAEFYLNLHPHVEQWSPMIVRLMKGVEVEFTENEERLGTTMDIHFIGVDTETGLGGPVEIVEGEGLPGSGEVVVDKALADRFDLDVGATLRAGGVDWRVAGISRGGDFVATQTVFAMHEQAAEALRMAGSTTFYVIELAEGIDGSVLVADLEDLAQREDLPVVVFTREEFASNTRERIITNVVPILLVVLALAFIVGLAVAGLTIYTATIEKSREYGILKAVGFRNAYLYRLVFEQSAITALMGFLAGLGLTLVIGPFASDYVPQFVLFTRWQDVLIVAAATVLMAVLAAYIPVRRLAAIDPVSVFKG